MAAEGDQPVRRFVVQRHRASRLHYDFRLELDGVLVSWSVPKGPSLDPKARRLAVRVEDHPVEYLEFEGVIPAGDYGGGDVIVWDIGTWEPAKGDPRRDLARGELHLDMSGEKLRGRFALVRREEGERRADDVRSNWLVVHKRDDHAVEGWRVEDHDRSVLSGLTNDQVARAPAATWSSAAPAADAAEVRSTLGDDERAPVPALTADELDALDELRIWGAWEVQGRELHLTGLDREILPTGGDRAVVTKRDLLRYLALAGPALVPFLRGRPLVRRRRARGGQAGTWAHTAPAKAPEWLRRWPAPASPTAGRRLYPVVDDVASLLWLGNEGTVELHPWLSRCDAPDEPSWAVIDIVPGPTTTWEDVLTLARLFRTALDHHTPNARGRTLVAPWSPQLAPGLPVSVPIGWDELDEPDLRPDGFTLDVAAESRSGLLPSPAAESRSGLLPSPAAESRSGLLPSPAADRLARPDPLRRLLGLPQSLPALDDLGPAASG